MSESFENQSVPSSSVSASGNAEPSNMETTLKKSAGFRKWAPLIVLSLALAIIIIDTTILNVSLSTIIREFNTNIKSMQWVITLYALILTAFTITGGRLGDLFGRKKMFVLGAVIFAVGSFITSISHGVGIMILGEAVIEGFGAALMMPATSSLLLTNYKGRDRGIAFGIWGGIAGASSALGPILGGYFTSNFSWRWAFRINVVVVIVLILGALFIAESRTNEEKPTLDWGGIALSSLGLLLIVFGVIESSTYGWWIAKEAFTIGGHAFTFFHNISITVLSIDWGLVFLAAFILWELRVEAQGKTPLVSMKLFRNSQFTSGTLTTAIIFLGQSGMFFTLPVFFQAVRNLDAFHTGLSLLPLSLSVLITAPLSGFLGKKFASKRIAQVGILINTIAFIVLRYELSVDATVVTIMPGLIMFGIGMGFLMAQLSNITLSSVPLNQAGEASGVNNTFRQLGSTLGTAIIGAVLLTTISSNVGKGVEASTILPAASKPQIEQGLAARASSIEFGGAASLESSLPQESAQEVGTIVNRSIVNGNKDSFFYASIFAFLGFLLSFKLPNKKNLEHPEDAAAAPAGH